MAVAFSCPCGRKLKFDDNQAGKRARCPECGEPVEIPSDASEDADAPTTAGRGKRSGRNRSRTNSSRTPWIVVGVAGVVVLVGVPCGVVGILGYVYRDLWQSEEGPKDAPALFASIEDSVKKKHRIQLDERGVLPGQDRFLDVPPDGALLIGFEAGVSFAHQARVASVRAIFLTRNGETLGPWHGPPPATPTVIKAKPGYVVGSITITTTGFLSGLSLTYVRLDGGRLLHGDSYTTEWVGSRQGITETSGGPGFVPVGVCGRLGFEHNVCALGLALVPARK